MRQYIRQSNLSTTKAEEANIERVPKKSKDINFYGIFLSRSHWLFYYEKNLLFSSFFQIFLQLTTRSFTINAKLFTVSNSGTQWTLDFGPDSVVLSVKDLNENLTISSMEIPLAA